MTDVPFDPFWVAEPTGTEPTGTEPAGTEPSGTAPSVAESRGGESTGSGSTDPRESVTQPRRRATRPARRRRRDRTAEAAPFERSVLAKVRRLATRLNDAGHTAVVDERIGRRPAGARLLVEPRRSPLQSPAASTVLELTIESGRLSARVWMDVFGAEPEALHPQPGEDADVWLDRVLIDFVATALSRA